MADAIVTPYRWPFKPPMGTEVDLDHPLMRGCVGLWLLNQGDGRAAFNLARNSQSCAFQGTTLPSWAQGPLGPGVKFASANTDQAINCGTGTDFDCDTAGDSCTMECWFVYNSTSSGVEKTLFAKAYNTSISAPAMALAVSDLSPSAVRIRSVFGTANTNNSVWLFTNGVLNHFVTTFTYGGNMLTYVNGSLITTTSISTQTPAMSGSALTIGGQQRTGSVVQESPDATIFKATIWNRALVLSEILELYSNPWGVILPPAEYRYATYSSTSVVFCFLSGLPTGELFGSSSTSGAGSSSLSPLPTGEAIGTSSGSGAAAAALSGLKTSELFGSTINAGGGSCSLSGLSGSQAFGSSSAAGAGLVFVKGLATSESFGSTVLVLPSAPVPTYLASTIAVSGSAPGFSTIATSGPFGRVSYS